MPLQNESWTCSACSLAWLERSTGVQPEASEYSAIAEIGEPQNINPTYGLMDPSGARLTKILLNTYDLPARNKWLTFNEAYAIIERSPGCLGGSGWNHWVGVRGVTGDAIHIANSAPGWKGVYDTLTREQFDHLGPFSLVYLD